MDGAAPIAFDNSYAGLPERFFAARAPTPVAAPRLIAVNERLAEALGIDAGWLAGAEGVAMLAGNAVPAGAAPIALAYAGHQFGQFVPALGDGRAVLLGEVIGRDGRRFDIQLKGSGPTRFSRRGDGRAALGPVLREYLVSEAMAALGVPTTRALAAVTTGETVMREAALPGAVLARVAASHIRVGTFAWFAARGDTDGLRTLTDYAIARHDPDLAGEPGRVGAFLGRVIGRQARLIAAWLGIGFIHGVMNTDNMAVSGETIDYGPCAFLDAYDPGAVFSSIDHGGRYAFGNQPRMALWNLTRLAEALLPLLGETEAAALAGAEQALASFAPAFTEAHQAVMRGKLGLVTARPGDERLVEEFLALLADNEADFTQSFRALAGEALPDWMGGWSAGWQARLAEEPGDVVGRLRAANPAVIPRNHLVEQAIAAALRQDYSPFRQFLAAWARPFDEPEDARLTAPPRPDQLVTATFCGT